MGNCFTVCNKNKTEEAMKMIKQKFKTEYIILRDKDAYNMGLRSQRSKFPCPDRGKGVLLLTKEVLVFVQYSGDLKNGLEIQRKSIRDFKTVKTWLRKKKDTDLLYIEWTDNKGKIDAIAFELQKTEILLWMNQLRTPYDEHSIV